MKTNRVKRYHFEWAAKQSPGEQYLVCEVRNVTVLKDGEIKSINIVAHDG